MLSENQKKCVVLMITSSKTQKQIAKEINVTEKTICEWKKDKEFQEEIQKQMNENFGSLAITAQKELGKLLKSKSDKVKIIAVKDVLDRAGYKAIEKVEVSKSTSDIAEEIDDYVNKRVDANESGE